MGVTSGSQRQHDAGREQIIDAALELFACQGFDSTTVEQVADKAGVSPAEFVKHFPTTEAVLVSIVADMAGGTAAALDDIEQGLVPERALLQAGTAAIAAVLKGNGPTALDRLLVMARTITMTRSLQRKVSDARKQVITQPLADWMGVDPEDRRLQRALTMWSAVAASAYIGALSIPDRFGPARDDNLEQRMIANLAQSFGDVMGEDPNKSG